MLVSQGNKGNLLLDKLLGAASSGASQLATDRIPPSFSGTLQITHPPGASIPSSVKWGQDSVLVLACGHHAER